MAPAARGVGTCGGSWRQAPSTAVRRVRVGRCEACVCAWPEGYGRMSGKKVLEDGRTSGKQRKQGVAAAPCAHDQSSARESGLVECCAFRDRVHVFLIFLVTGCEYAESRKAVTYWGWCCR
jgi:hypothetical protein